MTPPPPGAAQLPRKQTLRVEVRQLSRASCTLSEPRFSRPLSCCCNHCNLEELPLINGSRAAQPASSPWSLLHHRR